MEEIKKDLASFGLGAKHIEIYLHLVQHGELRIQEISNTTQIPRSSVYECLRELSSFGLIEEIHEDHFKKIKPYPVSAIRHTIHEKVEQYKKMERQLDGLEEKLASIQSQQAHTQMVVRYYKGIAGARQLFWNTLKAKSLVSVYSEYGRSKFVGKQFYKDFVTESMVRNIQERVLINPTPHAIALIKRDTGTSIARTKVEQIRMLPETHVAVKGETFIYDSIFAQIYFHAHEITGFEIESHHFTTMQQSIFNTLWNTAKPIKELL